MKNIGLIGCGNIAETYFRAQEYFNNINFVACADINLDAQKKQLINIILFLYKLMKYLMTRM